MGGTHGYSIRQAGWASLRAGSTRILVWEEVIFLAGIILMGVATQRVSRVWRQGLRFSTHSLLRESRRLPGGLEVVLESLPGLEAPEHLHLPPYVPVVGAPTALHEP